MADEARAAREAKRLADETHEASEAARKAAASAPYSARGIWVPPGCTPVDVPSAPPPAAPIPAPGETPWWLRPATAAGVAGQQGQQQTPQDVAEERLLQGDVWLGLA
jgi:hypothetical protein